MSEMGQNETCWTARASSAPRRLADLCDHRLTLVLRAEGEEGLNPARIAGIS